jgi:hypothetical protein
MMVLSIGFSLQKQKNIDFATSDEGGAIVYVTDDTVTLDVPMMVENMSSFF